ncbi:MAG: delta-lactam-biosynthetic de-N-acetylase [Clostridia bacterium]
MKNKKMIAIFGVMVIMLLFSILAIKSDSSTIETSVNITLSNKKIGWGIKRNDNHEQPDLGANNKKLIDENEDIAMGNNENKYVYLTFDNGYEAGYTSKILDTLKENDVKAAFFITGHYLNSQPDLVERMINEGHIVGNHTVNHYSMPDLSDEEIKKEVQTLHTAVYEKFNYEMKYLRPPRGEFSQRTLSLTKSLGYTTVMWSFAYDDWDENKQGREEYAKEKILSNIHNGCVMLLHANSKDNANILDEVIKEIKNMGYEFKTLDEFKR